MNLSLLFSCKFSDCKIELVEKISQFLKQLSTSEIMGNIVSGQMEAVAKKQMEFQMQAQRLQMERQLEMQNQMRIRMQALAIARARDMFTFAGTTYALLGLGLTAGAIKRKNPALFFPMVILSVPLSYTYDLAWGDKMPRVVGWAEEIMDREPRLLGAPHGMPTFDDIDQAIKARTFPSALRHK